MKKALFVTFILLLTNSAWAAISGAVTSAAGELAIINSDREAVWNVTPAIYSASYAVSDDGKTVYFASPKPGKVTFFAASVIDGMPELEQYTFYNGVPIDDENEPTPAPAPKPEPAPETIESIVKIQAKDKDPAELTALADTFAAVVDGIDRGVVTTPAGARETFRAIWADKGTAANVNALNDLSELISAISAKVDNTSLQTLKTGYSEAEAAIRSIIPAKAPAKKSTIKTKPKTENVKDCPNGQCPTGNCPNGKCNTYQYRWGW